MGVDSLLPVGGVEVVVKDFIKKVYQWKINFVYFFGLGYAEISTPFDIVYKGSVILASLKILFKIEFSLLTDIIFCLVAYLLLFGVGKILTITKMTQYANRLSNSYNPELRLVRKIAEQLNVKE